MKTRIFLFIIVFSIILNFLSFRNGHNWGDDFANYVMQSQAIANGNIQDLDKNMGKTEYLFYAPWGFPLLISPLINHFSGNINIIKGFIYCFFVLSMLFIYLLLKEERESALITLVLLATIPFFWEFKNNLTSDIPNLCFTFISLLLIKYFIIDKRTNVKSLVSNTLIGISIFICYYIRNQSIVLLPTIFIVQIIVYKKSFFQISAIIRNIIPYIIFSFLYFLSLITLPQNNLSSYSQPYMNLNILSFPKLIYENSFYYINAWSELFNNMSVIYRIAEVFTGITFVFFVFGISHYFKKNYLINIFFLLNIILLIITPFQQGIRYLIPLIPLYIFYFVVGLKTVITRMEFKPGSILYYSFISLLIFVSLKGSIVLSYYNMKSSNVMQGPYEKTSKEVFSYIRENTDEKSIIGFFKPRAMLLYSNRNSVNPLTLEKFKTKGIDYFVYYIKETNEEIPLDTLNNYKKEFIRLFNNKDFVIYKFNNNCNKMKDILVK